jgi:5S rRNA maturation endonuclease (ribonuclease M5)
VIDEAGMVGVDDMLSLLRMAKERSLKLVLAGDPRQLEAISRGNPFKAILERVGFFEMKDIQRQVDILDQIATRNLGKGDTGKAIDYYHDKGSIHIQSTEDNAKDIVAKYSSFLDQSYYNDKLEADVKYRIKDTLILTYTRADVDILNSKARGVLLDRGLISESVNLQLNIGKNNNKKASYINKSLGVGERIIFLKNKKIGKDKVKNGLFGEITAINGNVLTIITDEHKPRELKIDTKEYGHIDHGYAVTVHKSQGVSVQNTLGYISSKNWFSHLAYVLMSRHKRNMEVYVDKGAYKDLDALRRGLSSKSKKEYNVLDFVHKIKSNRLISKLQTFLGVEGGKYGLNQEVLDTNAKFAIVAELADVTRDVGREYYKLLGEDKVLSDDSQAVLQKRYAYRNELAYKVASSFEELSIAIDNNNLDLNQISNWSDNHVAETNFEKFINSSDVLYKGSIAESISNTQRGKMLLSEHDKWQEYSQCLGEFKLEGLVSSNVVTKEDIALVEKYFGYRDEAYSYYQKTKEEYFDDKDVVLFKGSVFEKTVKQSELTIQKYQDLSNEISKQGDKVAFELAKDLEAYNPILEAKYTGKFFDNVVTSIDRQAGYQKCREDVSKYKYAKGLTREQFAYRIAINGKEYARFVAEAKVDWKDINKDSKRLILEVFRDNLDIGVRPIFDSIDKYKETQYKVAEIMSNLSGKVSDKKVDILQFAGDEEKSELFKTIALRNELAYGLLSDDLAGQRDQELLDKLHPNFKLEAAEKHEALHIERLEAQARVEQYSLLLGSKDKNLELLKDITTTMTSRWGKHAFHVKTKKLNANQIFGYANQRKYDLENDKLTGVDKDIHRAIADYIIAKDKSAVAWGDIRLNQGDKEQAQKLGNVRNLRAYNVSKLIGSNPTSAMYGMFDVKKLRLRDLLKSAKEHELAIRLNEYSKLEPRTEEAMKLAKEISVSYPEKGFIYFGLERFGIDKKSFYTSVKIFDKNNKESKQAKTHFDLYKEASEKGVSQWQGKIADEILANRDNLKYIDKAGVDYNSLNISALEYRLENHRASKDSRIIEKLDFERINTAFKADINNYSHIFGSKTKETAKTISFGQFSVSKESGKWWDENQKAYRDPTEAMMKVHGTRHKQTGENYAEFVGRVARLDKDQLRFKEVVDPVKNQLQNDLADFKEKIQKQQAVQMLWDNSKPLQGSIADRYLKEHRGITDTSNLAMRYVSKGTDIMLSSGKIKPAHAPMLLVGGYNAKGEIVSAQRIYLDEKTANKNTQMDNPKLSMGLISGSGGLVQKGTSDRVYIVEGPETGASIAIADKEASVYCSFGLGNLSKLDKLIKANGYKEVILAADNDGVGSNAERLTKEAQQQLEKKGVKPTVIEPKAIEGLSKTDWNDVLKSKGIKKVQKQLGIKPKELEHSKKYNEAKEFLDKLERLQNKVASCRNLAKSVDQPIVYTRLSEEGKKRARMAKVTLSSYEKQQQKLFNKFDEKRYEMPKKIKKTMQFKKLNEMLVNKHKELKVAKEKTQDYSMEM